MTDDKKPKVTVWLARAGFRDSGDPRNPDYLYDVARTQNTVTPRVGDRLDDRDIQALIDKGVTVNIG